MIQSYWHPQPRKHCIVTVLEKRHLSRFKYRNSPMIFLFRHYLTVSKSLTPLFMLRRGPSVLLRVNTHPCHSLCLYKGGPSTSSCGTLGASSLILLASWVNARIWGGDRCFVFNPEDMDAAMEWNFYPHVGFSGRHISQLLLVVGWYWWFFFIVCLFIPFHGHFFPPQSIDICIHPG